MSFKRDFSDYNPGNTFKIATFAGEVVLAHWKSGYNVRTSEPYGFWEYISVNPKGPGIGSYGKSGMLVKFSEKIPADLGSFVPPEPKKPVAAAKNDLPFRVCDGSRKRRDELLKAGISRTAIIEILTKEFPTDAQDDTPDDA